MGATCNGKIPISQDSLFSQCQNQLTLSNFQTDKIKDTMINTNSQQIIYYISDRWKQLQQHVSGVGIIYKSQSFLYCGSVLNNYPSRGKLLWVQNPFSNITVQKYNQTAKNTKTKQNVLLYGKFEGMWSQGMIQSGKYYHNATQAQKSIQIHSIIFEDENPQSRDTIFVQIELPDKSFYKGQMSLNKQQGVYDISGFGQLIYHFHSQQKNPPQSYKGYWKENKMHGQGIFKWKNGEKYIGEYKNGLKHGKGKFYLSDNHYIETKWQNGKKNGVGTQRKDGEKSYIQYINDEEKK